MRRTRQPLILPDGLTPAESIALQRAWRQRLSLVPTIDPRTVRLVAGADISMDWHGSYAYAAVVVMDLSTGETLDVGRAHGPLTFPYVPGLLAFREIPLIKTAFGTLKVTPEVLLCDGQGYAHPRRMGLACMAGLVLNLPAVGCAKTRLCGKEKEPGTERGRFTWLVDQGERIGMALRTQTCVKSIYASPGQYVDFYTTKALILRCAPRFRLPEPLRRAHAEVNAMRRSRT